MKVVIAAAIAVLLAGCGSELQRTYDDFTGSGVRSTERPEPTRQQAIQKSIERRAP
jgi:hypothetical protein